MPIGNQILEQDHTVRPAVLDDLETLADIWLEGQLPSAEACDTPSRQEIAAFYAQYLMQVENGPRIWVANTKDGRILGWQALLPNRPHPIQI